MINLVAWGSTASHLAAIVRNGRLRLRRQNPEGDVLGEQAWGTNMN